VAAGPFSENQTEEIDAFESIPYRYTRRVQYTRHLEVPSFD
jgi:hypothetical protein